MKVIYLHIATGAPATIGAACDSSPNSGLALHPNPVCYYPRAGIGHNEPAPCHAGALRRDLRLPLRLAAGTRTLQEFRRIVRDRSRHAISLVTVDRDEGPFWHIRSIGGEGGIARGGRRSSSASLRTVAASLQRPTRLPPGCDSGHPGPRPAGALRASKIAPCDFVELTSFDLAERVRLTRAILALALRARYARPKSLPAILSNSPASIWRRGWDSNPRFR